MNVLHGVATSNLVQDSVRKKSKIETKAITTLKRCRFNFRLSFFLCLKPSPVCVCVVRGGGSGWGWEAGWGGTHCTFCARWWAFKKEQKRPYPHLLGFVLSCMTNRRPRNSTHYAKFTFSLQPYLKNNVYTYKENHPECNLLASLLNGSAASHKTRIKSHRERFVFFKNVARFIYQVKTFLFCLITFLWKQEVDILSIVYLEVTSSLLKRDTTFVPSCLLYVHRTAAEKHTSKRKEFAPFNSVQTGPKRAKRFLEGT